MLEQKSSVGQIVHKSADAVNGRRSVMKVRPASGSLAEVGCARMFFVGKVQGDFPDNSICCSTLILCRLYFFSKLQMDSKPLSNYQPCYERLQQIAAGYGVNKNNKNGRFL